MPGASRVDHLVDRSEERDAIHRELGHDGYRKTAVVHDVGGMVALVQLQALTHTYVYCEDAASGRGP